MGCDETCLVCIGAVITGLSIVAMFAVGCYRGFCAGPVYTLNDEMADADREAAQDVEKQQRPGVLPSQPVDEWGSPLVRPDGGYGYAPSNNAAPPAYKEASKQT